MFLRDVAPVIEDASDIATGYALVNGKRAVYILATRRADASTVAVVDAIKANLPKMQAQLPDDIKVSFEFDQSPYVTNAVRTVAIEAVLGAVLTGLMVLLFLRDWRSVIVVVLNIPLALTGSLVALALTGQTINLMTLGGLALSVGILVDEATVEVENIHTQMEKTGSIALAVRRGNAETAVPRLLAMLCVLAVFIPSFFMQGSAQALFAPLALAVGFAMIASYLLSSSFVPVLSVYLLRHQQQHIQAAHGPSPLVLWYQRTLAAVTARRGVLVPAYLVGTVAVVVLLGRLPGVEIFPRVDAGQFQFRLRAPVGTRIEETEAVVQEALRFIKDEAGPDAVEISAGFVGVVPSSYPINTIYLWTGGPEEALMRVALRHDSGVAVEDLKRRLREKLPGHLREWLIQRWLAEGVSSARVEERVTDLQLSFEPADIVNEVMSFGSPTPVEIQVSGPRLAENSAHAEKIRRELEKIAALRDLRTVPSLEYPTLSVRINREKASFSGVTADDVAKALVVGTSSSRFTMPNYWRDPNSGIGYQVQVEIPQRLMGRKLDIEMIPVKRVGGRLVLLRDVADVVEDTMPGEFDRYNMRRLVSLTANVEGADLGRVSEQVEQAIRDAGPAPAGVLVDVRGQVTPLQELTRGLAFGLGLAVAVILLLLTAYFQSPRLALVAVAAVPAVLAGVVLALLLTGTTLNLQSFMGAIMAVGVAVANAILLVTFAERHRRQQGGALAAALAGARARLRPILMTSAAMIAGMVPMALGLGESGDQTAPLGRAVIGGLVASTLATLGVLPAVFALVMSGASTKSASLDALDPASPYYVPHEGETQPGAV